MFNYITEQMIEKKKISIASEQKSYTGGKAKMNKANLYKSFSELEKIQNLLKNARQYVEKELGQKVLDAYLEGKGKDEIFGIVKHIVGEVYGYDQIVTLKARKGQGTKKEKGEKKRKTETKVNEVTDEQVTEGPEPEQEQEQWRW